MKRPFHIRALAHRRYQRGAVILTAALLLLFLLGFMGIATDFGRLFVVKTELQTAMDSCALAAAQELDGATDQLDRAASAGVTITTGTFNRVDFQGQPSGVLNAEVTFNDTLTGEYSRTFSPATGAKYAKCTHTRTGLQPWLLQAMSAFSGNSAYGNAKSVMATAVATRAPSQSNCVVPIGMCQKSAGSPWGYARGDWLEGITNDNDAVEDAGAFKWLDYTSGGGGAKEIKDLLAGTGQCGLPGTSTDVSKSGKTNGAVDAWNTRFGIYKGSYSQATSPTDMTGYAWYSQKSATEPGNNVNPGRYDAVFKAKRIANAPYQDDHNNPDMEGLKTQGSPASTDYSQGADRRIMTVGVVDCGAATLKLNGFACVLALHPMAKAANGKKEKMWLEFITDASAATDNPCTTIGLAGNAGGPKVPTLVQ